MVDGDLVAMTAPGTGSGEALPALYERTFDPIAGVLDSFAR